jgi:CxxC motif-containing protein (DUF1111 family)
MSQPGGARAVQTAATTRNVSCGAGPKLDDVMGTDRRWARPLASSGVLLVALGACSHQAPLRPGADAAAGSGDLGGADAGPEVGSAGGGGADADAPELPPPDAGGDDTRHSIFRCSPTPFPASYVTLCAACHTEAGPPNPRYPDLFAWNGPPIDFLKKTRLGGGVMPGFPPALISDADIQTIFNRVTMGARRALDEISLGAVVPLSIPLDAVTPPIVFRRDDGVLVTRGAGRLHARHEKEQTYGPYLPDYWSGRSYGFTIEDFTTAGAPHVRVTYLPSYKPDVTDWRAWKLKGDNNTFMDNQLMVDVTAPPFVPLAPAGGFQQFDETTIPPGRSLAAGETFEFELAVVTSTGAGGSTLSPFSDTFRYRVGLGGLTPENSDAPRAPGPLLDARLGGDATITWLFAEPQGYFDQMALDAQQENVQAFLEGRRLFYTDFRTGENVEAGQAAFAEQAGKAGPLLDAASCAACHLRNGAGAPLAGKLDETSSTVFRLAAADAPLRQLALQTGAAESGAPRVTTVMFADGTQVVLREPSYAVTVNGATPAFSARVARPLVGLGLLEAIDERVLIERADPLDCDGDGVSGRINYVTDPATGALRAGRFGWKAEKASLQHQVADDAAASLGVGTSVIQDSQGQAELSDADLARLVAFMRLGGVPPQRNGDDPQVQQGGLVFQTVGCARCHVTDALTSPVHAFAELRAQAVKPYTDLLLHDMGPDLADRSGVGASTNTVAPPSAQEWRTPPLWGIGLRQIVNGNTALLHDGRAADVTEAVLWHGGEATKTKQAFLALSADDRAALVAFVESL